MSSSSNVVNFSLRQNKAIERAIVFDGMQDTYRALGISDMVYIGFGSVWFSDFQLAHRQLGIDEMVSIEDDDVTFERAVFNKPFRTVDVVHGRSEEVLTGVLDRESIVGRPTIVWLDYDKPLDGARFDELFGLANNLPANSFLVTTFSVRAASYAKVRDREDSLADLFKESYQRFNLDLSLQNQFALAVGRNLERGLLSAVSNSGRETRGLSAFFLPYTDVTPMLTVGIFLPGKDSLLQAELVLADESWRGRTDDVIATPHLTYKEVETLEAALPAKASITREHVKQAGFDLEEGPLASFCKYYTLYPSFVQVAPSR